MALPRGKTDTYIFCLHTLDVYPDFPTTLTQPTPANNVISTNTCQQRQLNQHLPTTSTQPTPANNINSTNTYQQRQLNQDLPPSQLS
ncbi:hypothetical protein Pcinc_017538 [Petrolisthes cinctipes]|uniref:Uncharacterized protein n=1 Tax=Petrolisthes cinctipes TaxID=88211 RepID=A0AAE1FNY9_PETCI|nr:hypothetical protein Pcinc_017538 [Petrolisthes cinctipes]